MGQSTSSNDRKKMDPKRVFNQNPGTILNRPQQQQHQQTSWNTPDRPGQLQKQQSAGAIANRPQQQPQKQRPKPQQQQKKKASPPEKETKDICNIPSQKEQDILFALAARSGVVRNTLQVHIANQSNHTYESLFAKYMGPDLKTIIIVEPYLQQMSQYHNLVQFLECCCLNSGSLRLIQLATKPSDHPDDKFSKLKDIQQDLKIRNINFFWNFDASLHDRSLVFDNGHKIILGQGLHFYHHGKGKRTFFMGMHDQRLRTCKDTFIHRVGLNYGVRIEYLIPMELATELLVKAVKYDNDNRKVEALSLYTEGINKLLIVAKTESDATKKQHYNKKIEEFLNRAEVLKKQQAEDLAKRKIVKQIHVAENATGYSYSQLFGKYLDGAVREIIIEEPYLGRPFQLYNLLMFIELSVLSCGQLKIIKVVTKRGDDPQEQAKALAEIRADLMTSKQIKLDIEYSDSLHDRSIVLDNGYTLSLGRGLHIFKRVDNKYGLGHSEYTFRKCFECKIGIFFSP